MEPEIDTKDKEHEETAPLVPGRNLMLVQDQTRKLYYSGCCNLPFFIAIAVILSQSHDDCDEPIRQWLYVLALTYIIGIAAALFEVCTGGLLTKAGGWILIPMTLLSLFQLAWYIVGSVWLFSDENCIDDWQDGYILSLVILIFFYVFMALVVLVLCCMICCAGIFVGVAGAAALSESRQHN